MTKTALISVYDKDGIVAFAKDLRKNGWTSISSGGSYRYLQEHDVVATKVEDITGFPEILGGRVKTLHPKIHGGLLSRDNNQDDQADLVRTGITKIDMVVCNLYPFKDSVNSGKSHADIIENIDIGGPAMIRAAAKNYNNVFVITDSSDYRIPDESDRHQLAAKAFTHTASYDAMISSYFNQDQKFQDKLELQFTKNMDLRYGENPHQKAAYYRSNIYQNDYTQLHGKELSYNNINDMTKALEIISEFERPTAVALKHANPCGIASADEISDAFKKAKSVDPVSIFGGIIALNRDVDMDTAEVMSEMFLEVVIAPAFDLDAYNLLSKKKNIRLLEFPDMKDFKMNPHQIKDVINGILVQDRDNLLIENEYEVMSKAQPNEEDIRKLLFAWKAAKHIDSNGIVIAKDEMTIGLGHGETQRFWACEKAVNRSLFDIKDSVMASDGFFFEDTVEFCHKHKIKAMIQPGGSLKDPKVIDLANKYGMVLIFTKTRHFKH